MEREQVKLRGRTRTRLDEIQYGAAAALIWAGVIYGIIASAQAASAHGPLQMAALFIK